MPEQRGAVDPLLEKHQPQRVLAVDMDGVGDTSRLAARTMDMFEAQPSDFVETILSCRHAAGYHDHQFPRPIVLSLRPLGYSAAASSSGCCGQRFSAARPASVST